MLKLQNVNVRFKCSRHQRFKPEDGRGAIKGGCTTCERMVEAYEAHSKAMRIVRELGATRAPRKKKEKPDPQLLMFAAEALLSQYGH